MKKKSRSKLGFYLFALVALGVIAFVWRNNPGMGNDIFERLTGNAPSVTATAVSTVKPSPTFAPTKAPASTEATNTTKPTVTAATPIATNAPTVKATESVAKESPIPQITVTPTAQLPKLVFDEKQEFTVTGVLPHGVCINSEALSEAQTSGDGEVILKVDKNTVVEDVNGQVISYSELTKNDRVRIYVSKPTSGSEPALVSKIILLPDTSDSYI